MNEDHTKLLFDNNVLTDEVSSLKARVAELKAKIENMVDFQDTVSVTLDALDEMKAEREEMLDFLADVAKDTTYTWESLNYFINNKFGKALAARKEKQHD